MLLQRQTFLNLFYNNNNDSKEKFTAENNSRKNPPQGAGKAQQ